MCGYTAEGCVVCVDAARFLPDSTTISKVTATVYTAQRQRLASAVGAALPSSSSRRYVRMFTCSSEWLIAVQY